MNAPLCANQKYTRFVTILVRWIGKSLDSASPHYQNRIRIFLFSVSLLFGLIIGCAAPLANPTGPNSSLIIGKVVIYNQYSGRYNNFPLGTITDSIIVEIERGDGEILEIDTGPEGYFMVPNLPNNLYYVKRIELTGEGEAFYGFRFGGKSKKSFTPVPGKVIYVGEWSIQLSNKGKSKRSHFRVLSQEVKSYLSQRFPRTPWLARQFIEAPR